MGQMNATDANNIITEVDILNGEGPPFWGFEKMDTPLSVGRDSTRQNVYMTYKKGVKRESLGI